MNLTTGNTPSTNREFELLSVFGDKRKAKKRAAGCRRHGFHTRVMEVSPGTFAVFRRQKQVPRKKVRVPVRDAARSMFVAGFITDSSASGTRS